MPLRPQGQRGDIVAGAPRSPLTIAGRRRKDEVMIRSLTDNRIRCDMARAVAAGVRLSGRSF